MTMGLREIEWEDENWIYLAQERDSGGIFLTR
jgi:hypothetical protein